VHLDPQSVPVLTLGDKGPFVELLQIAGKSATTPPGTLRP
jgi:hypothetical protein